jgi:hypothetical protein
MRVTSVFTRWLVCVLAAGVWTSTPLVRADAVLQDSALPASGATGFICPMHLTEASPVPGSCRVCKMDLVAARLLNLPPYSVELSPGGAVEPGVPFVLRLLVREPGTQALASQFDLVHEMWYHLFVVSRDLDVYQHLHPDPQPDGSWAVELTLPAEGHYFILSDFVPTGKAPQFIRSELTTARAGASHADTPLAVTLGRPATVDTLRVDLAASPNDLRTGRATRLDYQIADAATGEPVIDLQPYLGAFGHLLVVREGVTAWVHSHPVDGDALIRSPRSRGGPKLSFMAWFTGPGRYRAWAQFMRDGQVHTIPFTFDVGGD